MELTQERLKELLHYDPETGEFTRISKSGKRKVGNVNKGYLRIKLDGTLYSAHRLAWLYVTKSWPSDEIDHIDGDRLNNSLANLREATRAQNLQNKRAAYANNTSGLLGAAYNKREGRWYSTISRNGKSEHLGTFATAEEAHTAYLMAKRELHSFCTI